MKHEWRKHEKEIYMPKAKPVVVEMPTLNYFSIKGQCNPNTELFGEYIGVLYALSYAIRMSHKKGAAPEGYFEYTVYPLEGVWDITDEAKKTFDGTINKDDLVFNLMIRQPDFVTKDYALEIIEQVKKSKPHRLLDEVKFEAIDEGKVVQMLHKGSFDDEPATFEIMEEFTEQQGLERLTKVHREVYLSDARRVEPDKLKTVLRFKVR